MTPIKCYPIKPYIEAQMWKPKKDRTTKPGTQKEFAEYTGAHKQSVFRWCKEGWIIDDNGVRYSPQSK